MASNAQIARFKGFMVPALEKAGKSSIFEWSASVHASCTYAEFGSNRIGAGSPNPPANQLAFRLYLEGELSGYKLDSGKLLTEEFVLGLCWGRLPSKGGRLPAVGSCDKGWKPGFSKFWKANVHLMEALDSKFVDVGGFTRPSFAYAGKRKKGLTEAAEVAALFDSIAAPVAMERSASSLEALNSSAGRLIAMNRSKRQAADKNAKRIRKNRKARERRAAKKASKS